MTASAEDECVDANGEPRGVRARERARSRAVRSWGGRAGARRAEGVAPHGGVLQRETGASALKAWPFPEREVGELVSHVFERADRLLLHRGVHVVAART